jgi:hypothetical protein
MNIQTTEAYRRIVALRQHDVVGGIGNMVYGLMLAGVIMWELVRPRHQVLQYHLSIDVFYKFFLVVGVTLFLLGVVSLLHGRRSITEQEVWEGRGVERPALYWKVHDMLATTLGVLGALFVFLCGVSLWFGPLLYVTDWIGPILLPLLALVLLAMVIAQSKHAKYAILGGEITSGKRK